MESYSRALQAVVDLGGSKIVCAIGRFDHTGKKLEILSASQTASAGLSKGFIQEPDALENAILRVVSQAEQEFGESIKSVTVGISNTEIVSEWVRMHQSVAGHVIDETHLKLLLDIESTLSPERDFDVLFSQELAFSLDDHRNIASPIGMQGTLLKAILHVLTAKRDFLKQLRLIFKRCHLVVDGFFHLGFASGLGTTSKDERLQGVTVVDIGAELTNLGFFHHGVCVFNDVIPVGGKHLTQDIAAAFQVSFSMAERLKNLYGGLIISPADRHGSIVLKKDQGGTAGQSIKKSDLIEVLYYRVQELFFLIKHKAEAQNLEHTAARRYVLTGGGSLLPGMRELGNRLLEKPLRLGRPLNTSGTASFIEDPSFSSTAGLLYASLIGQSSVALTEQSFFKKLSRWMKENL
jgi:cell division protein FtsA